mmetsp:Transcript_19623/g.28841  ORF Transcript_19623/g.28841 Transcript_19623/m.28841 type:complete len:127 (-) Transcript_19623:146-526(-)
MATKILTPSSTDMLSSFVMPLGESGRDGTLLISLEGESLDAAFMGRCIVCDMDANLLFKINVPVRTHPKKKDVTTRINEYDGFGRFKFLLVDLIVAKSLPVGNFFVCVQCVQCVQRVRYLQTLVGV